MKTEYRALIIGGVLSVIPFMILIVPIVPYGTRVTYYDFINGQVRGYSLTLGIKFQEQLHTTQYGILVKQLGLKDKPMWFKRSFKAYYGSRSGGYSLMPATANDLATFTTYVNMNLVDEPTSEILAIQAVARRGDIRALRKHTFEMVRRIVATLPEDNL